MQSEARVHGKIILSGEYAVVFGYPGIAVPSKERMSVAFQKMQAVHIDWKAEQENKPWISYARKVAESIEEKTGVRGLYVIKNHIPLGKGMGSSTALVIAMCRAAAASEEVARAVEEEINPGNSGIDFAVIWKNKPVLFQRGKESQEIDLPAVLEGTELIDAGTPAEQTPELVAWVKEKKDEPQIHKALETIGQCTERILRGEDINAVIRDHHRAQVALGVVPPETQKLIAAIEAHGGAAKVIGAGSRTGGGGMVLAWK